MRLYLIRHAEAAAGDIDPDRVLTPHGRKASRRIGAALEEIGVDDADIVHSGFARARQTAEIIAKKIDLESRTRISDYLEPDSDPSVWLERIGQQRTDLIVVGHAPHLKRLLGMLMRVSYGPVEFQNGAVLCLVRSNRPPSWNLEWMLTAELLEALR